MSNFDGVLDPASGWPDIPQASTSMVVLGGEGGPLNEQATQLTARTKKLKEDIENISSGGFGGQYKNLVVTVSGVGYQGTITADRLVVEGADYSTKTLRNVSVSFDGANAGANGIDAGVISSDNWYYLYVIYNGETTASLISLSSTTPTLPSGYTKFARVGAARSLTSTFRGALQTNGICKWGATVPDASDEIRVSSYDFVNLSLSSRMPPVTKTIILNAVSSVGSLIITVYDGGPQILSTVPGQYMEAPLLTRDGSINYKGTSSSGSIYFTGYIDVL